jgi:molybdate transport system substrate-binding protein
MDYLEQRGALQAGSRHNVVGNRLVLIAPADSSVQLRIASGMNLLPLLGSSGKLATGDPDSVPVGKYAQQALQKLGVWDQVARQIARAENVRAALAYVARKEAPLGIVYRTDALAESKVRIVAEFPGDTHQPIIYPVALTTHDGAQARQFLDFLRTRPAADVFRKYGFDPLQ